MRSNNKHIAKEWERYIHLYIREGISLKNLREEYGLLLAESSFNDKVLSFQEHGSVGIQLNRVNNHYSKEFKESIVRKYIEEAATIKGLTRKYNVPADRNVRH